MITFDLKITQQWERLRAANDRLQRRALFRIGGYGRAVMRRSFRKRKGPSTPPAPPHSHAGQLRDLSAFSVDLAERSVTIGILPFKTKSGPAGVVPELLDAGGSQRVTLRGRQRTARYKARPFVRPAFQATLPKVALFLEQSK